MSGIQPHSRSKSYPATVVCIGGFPTKDNDYTAQVWYRGIKIDYPSHKSAELIARHLGWFEREYGVEEAKAWAKSAQAYSWVD